MLKILSNIHQRKEIQRVWRVVEAILAYEEKMRNLSPEGIVKKTEELRKIASQGAGVDYKSRLQELIQAKGQQPPAYYVVEATGPDHDRQFTVEVRVGDDVLGRGSGKSKKSAETEAARSALKRLALDFTQ